MSPPRFALLVPVLVAVASCADGSADLAAPGAGSDSTSPSATDRTPTTDDPEPDTTDDAAPDTTTDDAEPNTTDDAAPAVDTASDVASTTGPTPTLANASTTVAPSADPPQAEPASTIPPPDAEIVYYRAGDEDPAIVGIQEKLVVLGYLDAGEYTPGLFDRATNDAVVAFQSQYGVLVDGVVGPETRRSLAAAAASVTGSG